MRMHFPLLAAMALIATAACHNNDQGGNGPGNADGAGGRTDPPTEPSTPPSAGADPSSHTENAPGNTGNPPGDTTRKPDAESPGRQQ